VTAVVSRCSFPAALVLALAATAVAGPAVASVTLDPATVHQGDIVRVTVALPAGARDGSVSFRGRDYPGVADGTDLTAYVGVDLELRPGLYELKYRAGGETGSTNLRVRAKDFGQESLKVASRYAELDSKTQSRVAAESKALAAIWNRAPREKLWTKAFIKPVPGHPASPFGLRRIFNGQPRSPHTGVDLRAPMGAAVAASNDGVVVFAGELYFTGNTIILDHGLGLYTLYAHLSRIDVDEGDAVHRAQRIGLVGATGRVTGPHLHFGAKLRGARVDPATLPGMSPL
jgi:murein DD-endopeptidase MepM/ murein hydrolase activator NlpD